MESLMWFDNASTSACYYKHYVTKKAVNIISPSKQRSSVN